MERSWSCEIHRLAKRRHEEALTASSSIDESSPSPSESWRSAALQLHPRIPSSNPCPTCSAGRTASVSHGRYDRGSARTGTRRASDASACGVTHRHPSLPLNVRAMCSTDLKAPCLTSRWRRPNTDSALRCGSFRGTSFVRADGVIEDKASSAALLSVSLTICSSTWNEFDMARDALRSAWIMADRAAATCWRVT